MATRIMEAEFQAWAQVEPVTKPALRLVRPDDPYAELERPAPGVASRGVHSNVLVALVGFYAMMVGSFWAFFARDPAAAGVLVVVTLFMVMYFSLIVGGILLADSPAPGERQRSFGEFLNGPVEILAGTISGREAAVQILLLPAAMMTLATVIGVIARLS